MSHAPGNPPAPKDPWRSRGGPHYLDGRAPELGVSPASAKVIRGNQQLHKISTLIGQIHPSYWNAPRYGDERRFSGDVTAQARGVLASCEAEIGKLALLTAAAIEMVDEGHAAFDFPPAVRPFRIVVGRDTPAESVIDVRPPAVTDEELASLRSDVDRLSAANAELQMLGQADDEKIAQLARDNAELLDQNKQLAAMVEQYTTPAAEVTQAAPDESVVPLPAPQSKSTGPDHPPRANQKGR